MADYSRDYSISHDDQRGCCTIRFRCFDTPNSVSVFGVQSWRYAESVLLGVRALCLDLHELWSFSSAESDIAHLNETLESVEVNDHTARILAAMQQFCAEEPLFDFTIGNVSFLWKKASRVPMPDELAEAMSHVGHQKVSVERNIVHKLDPHVRVDVGGAAKGYAADEVARYLRRRGISSADIDLGGNLYMVGAHPEGRPWRVSIRVPEGVQAEREIVEVVDASVVTSGSYERFVEIDGVRYQHIIDPLTGWPSKSDIVSATVVASSSLRADMLATTACLVGSYGLPGLEARHPEASFHIITA